jgi:hypothetical protein
VGTVLAESLFVSINPSNAPNDGSESLLLTPSLCTSGLPFEKDKVAGRGNRTPQTR